ncbi:MAG: hypothetical protein IJZ73_06720 [Clostridia bacterium]|nr:hypothetical protein [Clostridia bacterium]
MKKIIVSDTTLNDVYAQDLSVTFRERLSVAEKLDLSLVNAIELPALSNAKEDEVIYRTIASSIKNAKVKIPVGDSAESLQKAINCVSGAEKFGLQVVMPVSTAQMEYFFHLKAPAMLNKIVELVSMAKKYCKCVEFVAKDSFRAEECFIEACAKSAYEAGACSITISDDAGEALPEDYANIVKKIKSVCDIKVFVQSSNALGMAVSNVLEAIKAGADGVKTSSISNGVSISALSKLIQTKKFALNVECGIDSTKANTISNDIVAILSANAPETEDGVKTISASGSIKADATLKDIVAITKKLGYDLSDDDFGKVYDEVKRLTVKKESIDIKELEAVIATTAMQVPSTYHLVNYVVNSGNIIPATANVTLEKDGEKFTGVSTGDGPIDAAFHAIEQIIGHHYELDEFQVQAVTKGRGAVGSSIIRLRADGKLYPGNGVSTDIIGACIRAYINALNKIVYEGK